VGADKSRSAGYKTFYHWILCMACCRYGFWV